MDYGMTSLTPREIEVSSGAEVATSLTQRFPHFYVLSNQNFLPAPTCFDDNVQVVGVHAAGGAAVVQGGHLLFDRPPAEPAAPGATYSDDAARLRRQDGEQAQPSQEVPEPLLRLLPGGAGGKGARGGGRGRHGGPPPTSLPARQEAVRGLGLHQVGHGHGRLAAYPQVGEQLPPADAQHGRPARCGARPGPTAGHLQAQHDGHGERRHPGVTPGHEAHR
ncbi:hypothetical protein CDAR_493731 [Caerostris darwini]|uniref:Uncharacterized protein n=1 Tax=Caerostris darwini TaxID=1538125 RepID=A0AAV4VSN6_9ARAC|nr:hypothetical protein CDAR_493731 [Caerostris darwini]